MLVTLLSVLLISWRNVLGLLKKNKTTKTCRRGVRASDQTVGAVGGKCDSFGMRRVHGAALPSERVTVRGAPLPVCVFTAQFCLWFIWNMSGIQVTVSFRKNISKEQVGLLLSSLIWLVLVWWSEQQSWVSRPHYSSKVSLKIKKK